MNIERLAQKLLRTADPQKREELLARAALASNCGDWLLNRARESLLAAPAAALRPAELAAELAERRDEPRTAAACFRVQAQALRALSRHADALTAYESAVANAQKAGDPLLAAQVQIGRIASLGWLERYDEAIKLAARLERELTALGAESDAAKVMVNAGAMYYRRDRYTEALACYERAEQVFARINDVISLAHVQNNRANVLTQLHRVDEAIVLHEQARTALAAEQMLSAAAKIDANIGYLRYVSGQYPAAIAAQFRARNEFTALGQEIEIGKADLELGESYRALNLSAESLECYNRAIGLFKRFGVDYDRAIAEQGRAGVLVNFGRTEEAFAALERAETIYQAHRNVVQQAHNALIRAYLLRSVGRNEEAAAAARLAERRFSRRNLKGWAAEARFLTADLVRESGANATRLLQSVLRTARAQRRGWLESRAERALGLQAAAQGKTALAMRHFTAAIDALEAARTLIAQEELHSAFLRDKLAVYEDIVRALLARNRPGDAARALEYVERSKSRLLLERVQTAVETSAAGSGASEPRERLARLRAELSRSYYAAQSLDESSTRRLSGGEGISAERLLAQESAYRDALREWDLTRMSREPGVYTSSAAVAVSELQANLPADETLVEFYILDDAVCAFTLTRDSMRVSPVLAPVNAVAYALRRLRYHLNKAATMPTYVHRHTEQLQAGILDTLTQLHDLLLQPLAKFLTTEKLTVIPHGILHDLPFHAFFDGIGYALDKWEIAYAPSAAVWLMGAKRRTSESAKTQNSKSKIQQDALLMGVPDPGIEQVSAEVAHLARLMPKARVYCGEKATLAAFRAEAGKSQLIHLAMHALFRADNPLFSGLRFADGWLLARDLYEIALDCELTTLSACRTGAAVVEPGDELFGLIRGFLRAGARSLAVSLWAADDRATADLMGRFYTLLAQGVPKAAALRTAQQQTRCDFPHPYHWAAFSLVGER